MTEEEEEEEEERLGEPSPFLYKRSNLWVAISVLFCAWGSLRSSQGDGVRIFIDGLGTELPFGMSGNYFPCGANFHHVTL